MLERCDTSVEGDVKAVIERVRIQYGPLSVVVHAAGVLSDTVLAKQGIKSMQQVWAPTADGAWFLHKHSQDQDKELGAFVLYSSVASLFGNVGQANYSAANAYLDELARWRVGEGLPGASIQWPAVWGVGVAAAMLTLREAAPARLHKFVDKDVYGGEERTNFWKQRVAKENKRLEDAEDDDA